MSAAVNCCVICLELGTFSLKVLFFFIYSFYRLLPSGFLFHLKIPKILQGCFEGLVQGTGTSSGAHLFPPFLLETLQGFCIDSERFIKRKIAYVHVYFRLESFCLVFWMTLLASDGLFRPREHTAAQSILSLVQRDSFLHFSLLVWLQLNTSAHGHSVLGVNHRHVY